MRPAALLLLAIAAGLAAQEPSTTLVDRAVKRFREAGTVRASFEQALTSPATGTVHTSRGEYFQGGGSRFALRFADPAGDAIVNDGAALWLYLPSSAKGQVIKLPSGASTGFDVLANLLRALEGRVRRDATARRAGRCPRHVRIRAHAEDRGHAVHASHALDWKG